MARQSFLFALALVLSLSTAAPADDGYYPAWYDSLYFRGVQVSYSGAPGEGELKAGLYWHEVDVENRLLAVAVQLDLSWSGPALCDSFVPSTLFADSLIFEVSIDNENKLCSVSGYTLYYYPPVDAGLRKLGDLYYSLLDTGIVSLEAVSAPYFVPIPAVSWYGTFTPMSQQVNNPGDLNADGVNGNIDDVVWLIDYIFGAPDPAAPLPCCDVSADCLGNITDVVYLIQYIFQDGPGPQAGCEF